MHFEDIVFRDYNVCVHLSSFTFFLALFKRHLQKKKSNIKKGRGQITILFLMKVKQEGSALLQVFVHIWGVRAVWEKLVVLCTVNQHKMNQ